RRVIHEAVGGGPDDVVLFCGSGSTAAINMFVRVLELDRHRRRPVVFIGPYEHHSNELPGASRRRTSSRSARSADGRRLDLGHLEHELRRRGRRPLKIASFSAASNVTGIITDVERVTRVVRSHGALACWDHATSGPYLPIDVSDKDAVFLSPHKFVGGPGTPGVLVVKRSLLRNRVPSVPGGGTILLVSPRGHTYYPHPVIREEGGTPDIEILGSTTVERLPIVTFGLRHPPQLLHSAFVVTLLSDLFGIRARSGCFCA